MLLDGMETTSYTGLSTKRDSGLKSHRGGTDWESCPSHKMRDNTAAVKELTMFPALRLLGDHREDIVPLLPFMLIRLLEKYTNV